VSGETELREPAESPVSALIQKLLFGGSFGAGATIAWLMLEALRAEPKMLITTLGQWGATPMLLLVGMYFGNERMGQGLKAIQEHAASQQQLANAVERLAERDDRAEQKQALQMGYISEQLEKVLARFDALETSKARGVGA
jgi:hypothetical protein